MPTQPPVVIGNPKPLARKTSSVANLVGKHEHLPPQPPQPSPIPDPSGSRRTQAPSLKSKKSTQSLAPSVYGRPRPRRSPSSAADQRPRVVPLPADNEPSAIHDRRPDRPHLSSKQSTQSLSLAALEWANGEDPSRRRRGHKISVDDTPPVLSWVPPEVPFAREQDSTSPFTVNLDKALCGLTFQVGLIRYACEEGDATKINTMADTIERAMNGLIETLQDLPAIVRASPSYKAGESGAVFMKDVFMYHVRKLPRDGELKERRRQIAKCITLRDLMLENVRAFLVNVDKELTGPKPNLLEGIGEEEQLIIVPLETDAVSAGEKSFDGPIILADSRSGARSAVQDRSAEDVHRAAIRASGIGQKPQAFNIRDSVVNAFADEPPRDSLWDVELPYPTLEAADVDGNGETFRGMSLPAMVHVLTQPGILHNTDFVDAFFLCFRFFTKPKEVVKAFVARYNETAPSLLSPRQHEAWALHSQHAQLRAANMLMLWIKHYWRDDPDAEAIKGILEFAEKTVSQAWPELAQQIVDALQKIKTTGEGGAVARFLRRKKEAQQKTQHVHKGPTVIPPRTVILETIMKHAASINIMLFQYDENCLELARQLTLVASEMFCELRPEDILIHFGHKSCNCNAKPKLTALAAYHDAIAIWVVESVLRQPDAKSRGMAMMTFIAMGIHCLSIRNFDSLLALVSGMRSHALDRLEDDVVLITKKAREALDYLTWLAQMGGNFRNLRCAQAKESNATVPAMPLYLRRLCSILEGTKREVPSSNSKKIVPNMSPYICAARLVRELEDWHTPYTFPPAYAIQQFVKTSLDAIIGVGIEQSRAAAETLSKKLQPVDRLVPRPSSSPPRPPESLLSQLPLAKVLHQKLKKKPVTTETEKENGKEKEKEKGQENEKGKEKDELPPAPKAPRLPRMAQMPQYKHFKHLPPS
ncbi:ras GEF [Artomyces pyxidatus]|uniref:Ras GEF n=1 Tax=Artomyces pyxidatus TaxID=48021 RepID=A0ACB8SY93_9AGAM|nr:ras GEF [Artomyces pyxidatus]